MRFALAIGCGLLVAGCDRRANCPQPETGQAVLVLGAECLTLAAAYATERSDVPDSHIVRVLSMQGCEQWVAFTNERKTTNNARCMDTSCDEIAPSGTASGQAILGGDRRWSGDQDEEVTFSTIDSSVISGQADLSRDLVWNFHADRLPWSPNASVSGSDPVALASRALWCDFCPRGDPSCGAQWPSCISDVCAEPRRQLDKAP
jgi:hypothetical protein